MQLGMIGLGRMGAGLVRRLQRAGHECVVYDVNPAAAEGLRATGAIPATDLAEFAAKLTPPRAAWIMVPAGFAEATIFDVAAVERARERLNGRLGDLARGQHAPHRARA